VDNELDQVFDWLTRHADQVTVGDAVRGAIDSVLDGVHTGRYSIDQLNRTEKTYIGTKVEHFLLYALNLPKRPPLDTEIAGVPVDVKFTLSSAWMIPPEAVGKLCILVSASDLHSRFSFGLIRADAHWLNKPNRDKKGSLSVRGRENALWLYRDATLPANLLVHLDSFTLNGILAKPRGQARVTELFRRVHGRVVNLTAVDTLGQQRDSSKRVRQARIDLQPEGILVLSIRYDRPQIEQLGYGAQAAVTKDGWIAVRQ
jgi:hypothetical protein